MNDQNKTADALKALLNDPDASTYVASVKPKRKAKKAKRKAVDLPKIDKAAAMERAKKLFPGAKLRWVDRLPQDAYGVVDLEATLKNGPKGLPF